ncbi:MAG: carbohydrate ABC transporter permease [Candidatus Hydrogenedentes bacterium]|nr:carbohydrate ABC transporter permease [Candidatus Hydrogenedentota bacterium]
MIWRTITYTLLAAGAAFCAFPFVWMMTTAFMTYEEVTSPSLVFLPATWQWGNVAEVFRAEPYFVRYFMNTFLVATAITFAVIVTSVMAGYAFARLTFKGKHLCFALILSTMMIPFEITIIPNFITIQRLGWYDSYAALIIPWCANGFSIFLLRQAFLGIPRDFFDAAKVDGCGHFRFLYWIATPLVRPMVVTVAIFAFLGSYNALIWPLVVTSSRAMRVVQVGLTVFWGAEGVRFNLLMCASAVVIMPTVGLYFLAQRHFLESSLSAGIKG